jgi:hypothetical protein
LVVIGLPFHTHGRTWLSVVHGAKSWYLFPPGYGIPHNISRQSTALQSVYHWKHSLLPLLMDLPKPVSFNAKELKMIPTFPTSDTTSRDNALGYQPLYCLQEAGDILYLPNAWAHLTINEGETIAFGGQAALYADKRYEIAQEILQWSNNDFETLKSKEKFFPSNLIVSYIYFFNVLDAALGKAHLTLQVHDQLHAWRAEETILIVTSEIEYQQLIKTSKDTSLWIQLQTISGEGVERGGLDPQTLIDNIQTLANRMKKQMNIIMSEEDWNHLQRLITSHQVLSLSTTIIILRLDSMTILSRSVIHQPSSQYQSTPIQAETLLVQEIEDWIGNTAHAYYLPLESSMHSLSLATKEAFEETKDYIK